MYQFNRLMAVLLTIWVCCPYVTQNTGLLFGTGVALLWGLTRLLCVASKPTFMIRMDTLTLAAFLVSPAISFLVFRRVYTSFDPFTFLPMLFIFFIGFYMYRFYAEKKDYSFLGLLALVALAATLLGAVMTLYYLGIDPMIAKSISQSGNTNFLVYQKSGIGSFGFIYLMLFITIACLPLLFKSLPTVRKKKTMKLALAVGMVVFILCIIKAGFSAAILLFICGGVLWLISFIKNKWFRYGAAILMVIAIVFLKQPFGQWLAGLQIENDMIRERIHDIGYFLVTGESGVHTSARFEDFQRSLESFFRYPLFGYNFRLGGFPVISPGGHAEWIDLFAVYGLAGGIPLMATIIQKSRYIQATLQQQTNYNYYSIICIVCIIYGFLDPFLRIYHIGFAMFLVVPAIPYLPFAFKGKKTPLRRRSAI